LGSARRPFAWVDGSAGWNETSRARLRPPFDVEIQREIAAPLARTNDATGA
jgi:hypothetical protein